MKILSCLTITLICLVATNSSADQSPPPPLFVEGYTDQLSYAPGEVVAFHLSTSAATASLRIERLGPNPQTVWKQQDIAGSQHAIPDRASSDGCNWPVSATVTVPDTWKSGVYRATLNVSDKGGRYLHRNVRSASTRILFVVRSADPGAHSKILLQLATNTYVAYCNWGGHSLYSFHDRDGIQGHRVSFDRPIDDRLYLKWEDHFIRWAEANGYVIDYAVNTDLEFHPEMLSKYRLVLSVGHDEYWSSPMRDHLEKFIADGGNAAFFSGNTCCWQVRSEDQGRALTCWKQWYNLDPIFRVGDQRRLSTLWSHHLVDRPENQLTGVGFLWGGYHRSHGQFMDGPASFRVHRPNHWVFANTNLKREDRFGAENTIVGYECDGCELEWRDGLPFPTNRDGTPKSFKVLGTCPAKWAPEDSYWYDRFPIDHVGAAVMGIYTQGGTVFTAGTTDWAHGLTGGDPKVIQITKNILDRLSK